MLLYGNLAHPNTETGSFYTKRQLLNIGLVVIGIQDGVWRMLLEDGRNNLRRNNSSYGWVKLSLERSWKADNVPFTREKKNFMVAVGYI